MQMNPSRMKLPARQLLAAIVESATGLTRAECLNLGTHLRHKAAVSCLDSHSQNGLIDTINGYDDARRWVATRKGRAVSTGLEQEDSAEAGCAIELTKAMPRTFTRAGTYTPAPIYTRPGSDAAYQLPSRIGSRLMSREGVRV